MQNGIITNASKFGAPPARRNGSRAVASLQNATYVSDSACLYSKLETDAHA